MPEDKAIKKWTSATYISELQDALKLVPVDSVDKAIDLLWHNYASGRRIAFCGNGGSAATAMHLPADFQKNISLYGALPWECLSLSESTPLITAWSNDEGYENSYAGQVRVWMRKGDILMAISGSGNSPNILAAVDAAREQGAYTIGLSGFDGGKLAGLVDHAIVVPIHQMQIVEDAHVAIGHALYIGLRERIRVQIRDLA